MNKSMLIAAMALALWAVSAFAHHPAADMVDEDTYENIDAMVADTPHADMTVEDCMSLMSEKHIRHLPVIDSDQMVGVVSIGDIEGGEALFHVCYHEGEGAARREGRDLQGGGRVLAGQQGLSGVVFHVCDLA